MGKKPNNNDMNAFTENLIIKIKNKFRVQN